MELLRNGARGEEVTRLQQALNDRSRQRGLPTVTVDGVLGPDTAAAVQRVGRALGAREETLKQARVEGAVAVGLQRMIRYPGTRTPVQLQRARDRQRKPVNGVGALEIISRETWGARAPRTGYSSVGVIARRVVHHSAFPSRLIQSPIAERAHMRTMQGWHFARGFSDIGYHGVVFPSGRVYAGRPFGALAAGVADYNPGSIHLCLAGNFEFEKPTMHAVLTANRVLSRWDVPLFGHYQLQANACPGKNLKPYLKEIA